MDFKLFLTNSIESKKTNFKPIDIIYKPTKHSEIEPIYYYFNDIAKAYTNFYSVKTKTNVLLIVTNVTIAEKKILRQERQKRHMENCSGVPGVIYNFNTQSLVSFEDNFHAKRRPAFCHLF